MRNSDEFHNAGNYIDRVSAGDMIIIDNEGRRDCKVWGDILTEMALSKNIGDTVRCRVFNLALSAPIPHWLWLLHQRTLIHFRLVHHVLNGSL